MALRPSLSVIIPALNEGANLAATVETVTRIVPAYFAEWEVLIFNDGSTDETGALAERMTRRDSRLRAFHHAAPRNLGACYREGIAQARMDYLILVPGDNECGEEVLRPVLSAAGTADVIIPYVENPHIRPLIRRAISFGFGVTLNFLSGQRVRYYNGTVLHKTELIKNCRFDTDGFGYQAELLVRLLARGHSYREVATRIQARRHGSSKAFRLHNVVEVSKLLKSLAFDFSPEI